MTRSTQQPVPSAVASGRWRQLGRNLFVVNRTSPDEWVARRDQAAAGAPSARRAKEKPSEPPTRDLPDPLAQKLVGLGFQHRPGALGLVDGAKSAAFAVLVGTVRDPGWVTFEWSAGLEVSPGVRIPLYGSLEGQCIRTGLTLYCEDTQLDPRVDPTFSRVIGARSELCVPLHRGDRVSGVLCLVSGEAGAFDDDMIAIFKRVGT